MTHELPNTGIVATVALYDNVHMYILLIRIKDICVISNLYYELVDNSFGWWIEYPNTMQFTKSARDKDICIKICGSYHISENRVWNNNGLCWDWEPEPRLNIRTAFPRYGDSHVKDKTVERPSHL